MRRTNRRGRTGGLTVLELLIVIAIILTLMGIVWCTFGPARERGRRLVCVSNLKQIYAAIQMYREEHGGDDIDEGVPMTAWQMGLPPCGRDLAMWLSSTRHVESSGWWKCPDDTDPRWSSYSYVPYWQPTDVVKGERRACSHCPTFSETVAKRGGEAVIMFDWHHAHLADPAKFVIVLRLDGQVDPHYVAWDLPGSWLW